MTFEARRPRRAKRRTPALETKPAAPESGPAPVGNGPEAAARAGAESAAVESTRAEPGSGPGRWGDSAPPEPEGYPWNEESVAAPPQTAKKHGRRRRRGEIEVVRAAPATEAVPVEPVGVPAATVEPTRPRPRRVRALASIIGLALVAFGTGLLVFNNMVMPHLIHSVGEVRVPDLTNLTVEQAERALRSVTLVLSRAGERFDPSVPRGFILSQDPPPETPVRGKKRVLVVVSLGEEFSTVPELFGESQRSAGYLLERAGLKLGAITPAPSEEVGDGLVAGSDPPAEALLARDTPVSILVSSGAGPESYVMPDVGGREINGVRRQLESLGFRVFTPPAAPSIGTIVFQDPPPGSRITRGATILLQATGRMIR